jgi:hypothetical protein
MEKDWSLIYSTEEPHLAEMMKVLLEDNGIEAVIINKKDSSYNLFGQVEIYINIADTEKANELVKQFES